MYLVSFFYTQNTKAEADKGIHLYAKKHRFTKGAKHLQQNPELKFCIWNWSKAVCQKECFPVISIQNRE